MDALYRKHGGNSIMDADFEAGFNANRKYKDSVFTLLLGTEEAAREVSETMFGEGLQPGYGNRVYDTEERIEKRAA